MTTHQDAQQLAADATALAAAVGHLEQDRDTLRAHAGDLEDQLTAARARIAELEAAQQPDEPDPNLTLIGMSAPANLWDQRLAEVGPTGVTARRIFATEMSIRARMDEINDAIANDMLPVLSFKGTPTEANVAALRAELVALDTDVTATYWHEPRGDITPTAYRAAQRVFLGVGAPNVHVGPILNGFLLNRPATMGEWESWSDAELLAAWDFIGVDLYQREGGTEVPGSQIPKLLTWLAGKGHPDMDIVVGEYNSFEAASIAAAGETFLSTPQVKIACVWNSTGKPGTQEHIPLEGDRLRAYQSTKADPRAAK